MGRIWILLAPVVSILFQVQKSSEWSVTGAEDMAIKCSICETEMLLEEAKECPFCHELFCVNHMMKCEACEKHLCVDCMEYPEDEPICPGCAEMMQSNWIKKLSERFFPVQKKSRNSSLGTGFFLQRVNWKSAWLSTVGLKRKFFSLETRYNTWLFQGH